MKITVVAFTDDSTHSVSYKTFETITAAVKFYTAMLHEEDVRVISTRKVGA